MNKTDLKNFAIAARLELLARVRDRAALYGITKEKAEVRAMVPSEEFQRLDGAVLTQREIAQRNALLSRVHRKGYVQVMEEAAYTWFNRLIALRYMEEHQLLPVDVRVLPEAPGLLPQLVKEAQRVEIDGVDLADVAQMLDENRTEELYRTLLIALCNQLSAVLPQMFEAIADCTELLFPDGILKADSVLGMLAKLNKPEDGNWADIQVIGWLYQYYNTELKQETFDLLKKNVKITKERIGAATQLFTPEWIVRYMVENSLGRVWQDGRPDKNLRMQWRYWLDEAEQEPEVAAQLAEQRKAAAQLQPEQITLLDPCMGSGHILVYAFDVLMQIYRSVGYTDRDAVESIVKNNLYGLDIDDRAAQLAYFALMMKACEYDRRFLRRNNQPHVTAIQPSQRIDPADLRCYGDLKAKAQALYAAFVDAKEYGSILQMPVTPAEIDALRARGQEILAEAQDGLRLDEAAINRSAVATIDALLDQAMILARKYHVVVTNPPYMKQDSMPANLAKYVELLWENAKYDLYAAFMYRCHNMTLTTGYTAMITMHNFMFSPSFLELRNDFSNTGWVSILHLGSRAFSDISGEVVQTVSFILTQSVSTRNTSVINVTDVNNPDEKEVCFHKIKDNPIMFNMKNTTIIPWHAIGYGLTPLTLDYYRKGQTLENHCVAKAGVVTGDDELFCKLWHEVTISDVTFSPLPTMLYKYVPFSRGGTFVRWYGNTHHVLRISDMWDDTKTNRSVRRGDREYYYRRGIGWSQMGGGTSKAYSVIERSICKTTTPMLYPDEQSFNYILGYLNSPIPANVLKSLNPTLSILISDILHLPYISVIENIGTINKLVDDCIAIARDEYDQYETSWDFQRHPLI